MEYDTRTYADMSSIEDFSLSTEPVRFRINEDVFECTPEIPLHMITGISKMQQEGIEQQMDAFLAFLSGLMFEDSAARFHERLTDLERPISLRHIRALLPWLLERYGLRPTVPSSESVDGSSDGDSTLTDTASRTESTSPDSNSLGS